MSKKTNPERVQLEQENKPREGNSQWESEDQPSLGNKKIRTSKVDGQQAIDEQQLQTDNEERENKQDPGKTQGNNEPVHGYKGGTKHDQDESEGGTKHDQGESLSKPFFNCERDREIKTKQDLINCQNEESKLMRFIESDIMRDNTGLS